MLPSFCTQTVTRLRAGTKTERGSTVPDWSHATSKDIEGCSMQPASTSLSTDGRVMAISDEYTLFAPTGADIIDGDRIQYGGEVYAIQGAVRVQPAAMRLDHIEIRLRRYEG